jgi:hypothetical protein
MATPLSALIFVPLIGMFRFSFNDFFLLFGGNVGLPRADFTSSLNNKTLGMTFFFTAICKMHEGRPFPHSMFFRFLPCCEFLETMLHGARRRRSQGQTATPRFAISLALCYPTYFSGGF